MRTRNTDEQFIQAARTARSIRELLTKLGLKEAGGNYEFARKRALKLGVDLSHFVGQHWHKGVATGPKKPLDAYLSNRFPIKSHYLKVRLLREGLLKHGCNSCGLSEWLSNPIPLELEHIDGNNQNNSFANLSLLCPNCHALTSTYRGKNIGKSLLVLT